MATTTKILPGASDIDTAGEGWREALGLTVHPDPNHVHGVTALTPQERRELESAYPEARYVVLYGNEVMTGRVVSLPMSLAEAHADVAQALRESAYAYQPFSFARLSVMAESDWRKVSRS